MECEVVVKQNLCPEKVKNSVCDVVQMDKKHFSQKCSDCLKKLAHGWQTTAQDAVSAALRLVVLGAPANAQVSNPALGNKRKAALEPEEELSAKKAKTEAEVERGKGREQGTEEEKRRKQERQEAERKQKKNEYQNWYRANKVEKAR